MELAPDWSRDLCTRGNFSPGDEILRFRRDSRKILEYGQVCCRRVD